MVEQPHSSKGHNHVVLVAFFDDQVIPNGTAGLGHVAHTGLEGPLDVVREGEEGIEPRETFCRVARNSRFSSSVRGSGRWVK